MSERVRAVVLAGHAGDAATARSALTDPDPAARAAALGALARCGSLTAPDLLAALTDPSPTVRRRAADEAARAEAAPSSGDAFGAEHGGSGQVRLGAALRAIGDALIACLGDPDLGVVEAAAHALGELPASEAGVRALGALCTHEEVVVRETAVAALGSLGDDAGRAAVLAATTDVATVRRRAVLALAAFDGDDVEAALERLAEDRDRQVRQAAEDLLHGWGGSD